jgi:hypothetical protein
MPGNVLTGKIVIDNSGVAKSFNDVSIKLRDQKAILKSLQAEYAKLSTVQISSPFGKELAADIKIAQSEIKRLEAGAVPAFGNIGNAATKGFSAIRQFAYILPGIGIAGIIGGLSEMAIELFKGADAFSKIDISAGRFDNTMRDLKNSLDQFKTSLEFEGKLEKLALELSGLSGSALERGKLLVDLKQTGIEVNRLNKEINSLSSNNAALLKTREAFEKTRNSITGTITSFAKAFNEFKSVEDIPDGVAKSFTKADQELLRQYKETNEKIATLTKQRNEAILTGRLIPLQIQTIKPDKDIKIAPTKLKIIAPTAGSNELIKPDGGEPVIRIESIKVIPNSLNVGEIASQTGSGEGMFKSQGTELKALANLITNTLTPAFQGFFDTVAGGGNAFKAFATAAGQALIALIEKLAIAAVLSLILSSITGAGAAIGAASGKFTDIFKFLSGFGGARAGGGPVSAGRGYLVGENGPEFFRPNTGGDIVPNGALGGGSISGGMRISGVITNILRGQDLLQLITIANQSKNRLV